MNLRGDTYNETTKVFYEYAISMRRCVIAIRAISGVELIAKQLLREDQDPEDQVESKVT